LNSGKISDWILASQPGCVESIISSGNFYNVWQERIALDLGYLCSSINTSIREKTKPSMDDIWSDVQKLVKVIDSSDANILSQFKDKGNQLISFNLEAALETMCDPVTAYIHFETEEQKARKAKYLKDTKAYSMWLLSTQGDLYNKYNAMLSFKLNACKEQFTLLCKNTNACTTEEAAKLKKQCGKTAALKNVLDYGISIPAYQNIMYPEKYNPVSVSRVVKIINIVKRALGESLLTQAEIFQLVDSIDYKGEEGAVNFLKKIDQYLLVVHKKKDWLKKSTLLGIRKAVQAANLTFIAAVKNGKTPPQLDLTSLQNLYAIATQDDEKKVVDKIDHGPPKPPPGLSSSATSCDPSCQKPSGQFKK